MVYAVSYYVEKENYWQFAGEFSTMREAEERRRILMKDGSRVRIRCIGE